MNNFWELNLRANVLRFTRNLSLVAAGLLLAGCPAEKETPPPNANPRQVIIRGSNTVGEELAPHLIAEFKKDHADVTFDVETKATGYGLAALRAGKCDLAAASRLATKEETAEADNMHVELVDHPIGTYGVAVVVHPNNTVTNLSKAQVRDIFTGAIQNWKDIGGPDAPIHIYIRDPISGTYLGFQELAMEDKPYMTGVKLNTSYEAIAQAVAQDESGIGYTGIELPAGATVKAVAIGGVESSPASVKSAQYPYARGLHLYTRKDRESAAAKDFLDFALSAKGQQVLAQLGFVPNS